jgi:hypothetical protein
MRPLLSAPPPTGRHRPAGQTVLSRGGRVAGSGPNRRSQASLPARDWTAQRTRLCPHAGRAAPGAGGAYHQLRGPSLPRRRSLVPAAILHLHRVQNEPKPCMLPSALGVSNRRMQNEPLTPSGAHVYPAVFLLAASAELQKEPNPRLLSLALAVCSRRVRNEPITPSGARVGWTSCSPSASSKLQNELNPLSLPWARPPGCLPARRQSMCCF